MIPHIQERNIFDISNEFQSLSVAKKIFILDVTGVLDWSLI